MPLFFPLLLVLSQACTPTSCSIKPPRHLELGPVTLPDVLPLAEELQEAIDHKEPEVIIDIDSPGGSVGTGLALLGMMGAARKQGMVITCRVDGMAASMAAVILEVGCTTRSMTPDSALLFHEPAISEVGGKESDFRRIADMLADMNKRIAVLVAPHLKGWTAARYMAWISGRDRWVSVDEAKEMGAVDAEP